MNNNSTSYQIVQQSHSEFQWLSYFDLGAALEAVAAHVAQLPSSKTPEQHTRVNYESGLRYWLNWSRNQFPSPDLVQRYIAHLSMDKGLKSSTIGAKYLAPLRLLLRQLAAQSIPVHGAERELVQDRKEELNAAAAIKTPRAETTSNVAPLWRPDFVRLDLNQVNAVLRNIDRATLTGIRDYALLHVAFSTGLRLAELARISFANLQQNGSIWIITVRGKRSNIDPVPISAAAYADLLAWVEAYNANLPADDPRRIEGNRPIWQPLINDRISSIGVNRYDPERGLSHQGIRRVIATRTARTLGERFALAAHDTRRTAAAIAYDAGMPLPQIQSLLRHKDAAVTLRYVGTKPDYESRLLETYVSFG